MKHLHMAMAFITIALFCYSGFCIFYQKPISKKLYAISHGVYFLVVVSGLYLAWLLSQATDIPHWLFAKIILVVVMVSLMVKARRAVSSTPPKPAQAKAGLLLVLLAMIGILYLAFAKPTLAF